MKASGFSSLSELRRAAARFGQIATPARSVALTYHLFSIARMEFDQLLQVVGDEPVLESGPLLAGDVDVADVHKQLSR